MAGRELQLVSVGNATAAFVKDLEAPIASILSIGAFTAKVQLATPNYAFNKDRGQYHTNAIMRRLLTVREPGALMVLGVTDVDLFVPDAAFVFGDADRESRTAVFSVFRLKADAEVLKRRAQLEAVHQVGHLVGLSYCEDIRCVMFLAPTLGDLDRRSLSLCSNCRNELAKQRR